MTVEELEKKVEKLESEVDRLRLSSERYDERFKTIIDKLDCMEKKFDAAMEKNSFNFFQDVIKPLLPTAILIGLGAMYLTNK